MPRLKKAIVKENTADIVMPDSIDETRETAREEIAEALANDEAINQAISDGSKMEEASAKTRSRRKALQDSREREAARESKNKENATFLSGWSSLATSFKTGRVVTGVISGITIPSDITKRRNADFRNSVLVNVLHNKQFRITVPFGELYRDYPIDMNTVSLGSEKDIRAFIDRQRAMAEKLYGLEIPILIDDMLYDKKTGEYYIKGSRANALKQLERINYAPNKDGISLIEVGSFVEATVMAVSNWAIQVDVGGVDTRIHVRELTYRFIAGPHVLKSMYKVGEKLLVQVSDIKQREDGRYVILATRKPAELLEARKRQNVICKENDACTGTITAILPSKAKDKNGNVRVGEVYIALYLDAYDLPAISNSFPSSALGMQVQPGDTVRVTIKQFNPSGMTYCWLRSTHGAPNLLNR